MPIISAMFGLLSGFREKDDTDADVNGLKIMTTALVTFSYPFFTTFDFYWYLLYTGTQSD